MATWEQLARRKKVLKAQLTRLKTYIQGLSPTSPTDELKERRVYEDLYYSVVGLARARIAAAEALEASLVINAETNGCTHSHVPASPNVLNLPKIMLPTLPTLAIIP